MTLSEDQRQLEVLARLQQDDLLERDIQAVGERLGCDDTEALAHIERIKKFRRLPSLVAAVDFLMKTDVEEVSGEVEI